MSKLKVNQELFVVYVGYNNKAIKTQTAKISKIGNKYFYLHENRFRNYKFYLETLKDVTVNASSNVFECYLTRQEWEDKQEHKKLVNFLKPLIHKLSLEQLREIHSKIHSL